MLLTYNAIEYTSQFQSKEKKCILRKFWINARPQTSWAKSKICISMFDMKSLFRPPTPFSCIDFNTLLSFRCLLAAFLGRQPMTLASPIFWGL